MRIPFTVEQFLDVFARFNAAIWPAQVGAYLLGVATLVLAVQGGRRASRATAILLGGAWAFVGVAYHALFFSAVNPLAPAFAAAFAVEGVLLALAGLRDRLSFRFAPTARHVVGLALVAYAAVVYPLLGVAFGHGYPRAPMFGVAPCPTTIFTFGILLLAEAKVPGWLLPVPFVWSLVGVSASLQLGMREDLGLAVAGTFGTALLVVGAPGSEPLARGRPGDRREPPRRPLPPPREGPRPREDPPPRLHVVGRAEPRGR